MSSSITYIYKYKYISLIDREHTHAQVEYNYINDGLDLKTGSSRTKDEIRGEILPTKLVVGGPRHLTKRFGCHFPTSINWRLNN